MHEVSEFLKRAATQSGFKRMSYVEKNIPKSFNEIVVVPFFADLRSTWILSTFLFNQIEGKYIILCCWPGFQDLFPTVNEYWQPDNVDLLVGGASSFYNNSDTAISYTRNLLTRFENVINTDWFLDYYNQGFQNKFRELGEVHRRLPNVYSETILSPQLRSKLSKQAVTIYPVKYIRTWRRGKTEYILCPISFWESLINRLEKENIPIVVYQNIFTYNFENKFTTIISNRLEEIMVSIRCTGCLLDIFSGVSRLAISSRSPFVVVDERSRFIYEKEYELDDLCYEIPRKYYFGFSQLVLNGNESDWHSGLFDNIVVSIKKLLEKEYKISAPNELNLSWDLIRKKQTRYLEPKFFRNLNLKRKV